MNNIMHIKGGQSFPYDSDLSLFEILLKKGGGLWKGDSPCGGKGTCGKCKIKAWGEGLSPVTEKEKTSLTPRQIQDGYRLACLTYSRGPVTVDPESSLHEGAIIQQDHHSFGITDSPLTLVELTLPPCSLEDQRDTLTTIRAEAGLKGWEGWEELSFPYHVLAKLPGRTDSPVSLRITLMDGRPVDISEIGATEPLRTGLVIDLGTTTVVCYLVDTNRGDVIDTAAAMNAQKSRGGDVISRIEYACQGKDALLEMKTVMGDQLQELAAQLMRGREYEPEMVLITGNPTMIHLLAGLDPKGIAQAPFVPQITETLVLTCGDLGWERFVHVPLVLPASLSGYIGSDILAGVIYTGMGDARENTLLLDLGTNGELVMGNREKMLSCSCAAGPAFEGANISAGMAGVSGAVSHIEWEGEFYSFKTIADEPARGICGTGIIDVTALLLERGIVDETGRFLEEDELPHLKKDCRHRLVTLENGDRAFLVAGTDEGAERDVYFTQRDVREVQMARAAIAGAVLTLLRERGIELDQLEQVYLAGGFGFWLREKSAIRIGLIPGACAGRVKVVGNSSGKGGLQMALDRGKLAQAEELRQRITYLELSSNLMYQNDFVMSMTFPGGQ